MSLDGHFAHDYSVEEGEADRLDYQHNQQVAAVLAAAGNLPLVAGTPAVIQRPAGPMIFFRALGSRGEWREGIAKICSGERGGYYWTAYTLAPWHGYRRGDETRLVGVADESPTQEECIAKALAGLPLIANRRWGRGSCLAIEFHAARPAFWDETGSPLPKVVAP